MNLDLPSTRGHPSKEPQEKLENSPLRGAALTHTGSAFIQTSQLCHIPWTPFKYVLGHLVAGTAFPTHCLPALWQMSTVLIHLFCP